MTTETWLLIFEFFGGLILVLVIGYFIGHLLKLDKYMEGNQDDNNENNQNDNNEDDDEKNQKYHTLNL
jgi:hypothetical protein